VRAGIFEYYKEQLWDAPMKDITGIGKLANSKLVTKVYDDALTDAAKQAGGLTVDLIKSLRLFTAPLQVASMFQDRLVRWLEEARNRVPHGQQTEAPSALLAATFEAIRFEPDDSELKTLYVELLAACIDKRKRSSLHPAFPHVLRQLSPEDAHLFAIVSSHNPSEKFSARRSKKFFVAYHDSKKSEAKLFRWHATRTLERVEAVEDPAMVPPWDWSNLIRLSLISIDYTRTAVVKALVAFSKREWKLADVPNMQVFQVRLTAFGHRFARSCIPLNRLGFRWAPVTLPRRMAQQGLWLDTDADDGISGGP
jgi:Abortive infection alpha